MLVSEDSGLPRILQQAFDDGTRPPPLALLQSVVGHEIPVANLSDPTSETALVYLLAIIDDGSVIADFPQIPNSWHTSLRRTAATALETLRHRSAGPLPGPDPSLARPQGPPPILLPPIVRTLAAIRLTNSGGPLTGATARGSPLNGSPPLAIRGGCIEGCIGCINI